MKSDRGLNISFTKDIILPPGGFLGGKGSNGQANIALSFKDDTNHYRCAVPCKHVLLTLQSPLSLTCCWSLTA